MSKLPRNPRPRLLRSALALTCGVLTGVLLAVSEEIGPMVIPAVHGAKFILPLSEITQIAITYSFSYAIAIALLAAPIWWILGKAGHHTWMDAAALGFVMAFLAWCLTSLLEDKSIPSYALKDAVLFGFAGMGAGLATWSVSYRWPTRRPHASTGSA